MVAFSRFIALIPATDRNSLCELGKVLYEELGHGNPDRTHSVLFERFALEVGVSAESLPLPAEEVLPGIRDYVDALEAGFSGPSVARAAATYVFLETSAVRTYGPLSEALKALVPSPEAREFFALHSTLEPEHQATAEALAARYIKTENDRREYDHQLQQMEARWEAFWSDIYRATIGDIV